METHCQGEKLLHVCFSDCWLHTHGIKVLLVTELLKILFEVKTHNALPAWPLRASRHRPTGRDSWGPRPD